ncbi:alkaline phosphatase family protein (plasmid) [Haloferax larsenii]|uniref:Alkaline phosphatase family protein n=1 Tax=Haloferax larsenii TaxID=302484 RepID=A0ABY5RLU4_HALLR|nr:alkaline phosphatase family protein [Haloferax larsenii]UVE52487.1 alkaline phosphatase family protein [Haloferax larsenii]
MSPPKVLIVGIDAACFEQLDPLVESGAVPTIADLLDTGVVDELETTHPPWTPSAWPSVVTGATPWQHGVYDFYGYDRDSGGELVSARDVQVPYLWEILSAHGLSSVVVNVPVTHPVHEFDGSLVPGYLATEGVDILVDGEKRQLDEVLPDYQVYAGQTATKEDRLAEYERLVDARVEAAETLADATEWDLMMVQFQSTDGVFHTDGDDPEAVERVYRRVDAGIERLVELAGPDAHVVLVSDHGIHQYDRVFYLNSWLKERGDLVTTAESVRHAWNEQTKHTATSEGDDAARQPLATRTLRSGLGLLGHVGVTPTRVERVLANLGLDRTVARVLPDSVLQEVVDASEYVDFERSAAFTRSLSSLGIRCNVEGRDPGGVIPADEFDAYRTRLVADLREVTAPDGTRVFDAVEDRHTLVGSDVAGEQSAPDILLFPARMTWKISDIVREEQFGETDEFSHTWTGLFALSGPAASAGTLTVSDATVIDVVPTVLSLFGIDPPDHVEGASLLDDWDPALVGRDAEEPTDIDATHTTMSAERRFFDDERDESSDGESAAEEESEYVADRLRELGYLE